MPGSSASTPVVVSLPEPGPRLALVTFRIDGARYALPLAVVERVLAMAAVAPLPGAPPVVLGIVNVRGVLVAVVDVQARLGLGARDWGPGAYLLTARTPRRTLALPVDEVTGVIEVAAASVVPTRAVAPRAQGVSGLLALPDGLLLIQDLEAFFSLDEEERLARALDGARP